MTPDDQSGPIPIPTAADLDAAESTDSKITFLRSTTTTRVNREADGDTSTSVEHVARFAIPAGAVPDMVHQYGSQKFRPQWAQVTWLNGKLHEIAITGQRVLKSGKLSDHGHASSRNYNWSSWDLENKAKGGRLGGQQVPEELATRIRLYESAVVAFTGKP